MLKNNNLQKAPCIEEMINHLMYKDCLKFLYHKKEFEELFRVIKREYEKIITGVDDPVKEDRKKAL
jgi:hypothetical protein